jgi:sodium/hydrogen exchanger 8
MPEAGMIIVVGIVSGGFIHLIAGDADNMAGDVADSMLSFSPSVFFIILLPPIIFNSGYHLHRQLFFRYISPICLFAFLGTIISMVTVAVILYFTSRYLSFQPSFYELLAFGALISATDPVSTLAVFSAKRVDPHLFYLLSGESLLNDAVGLVLFEAFAHLIAAEDGSDLNLGQEAIQVIFEVAISFFGSLILGTVFGLIVALSLKMMDLRLTPMLELSSYVIIMYAPFVLAEVCRLSGIVTVLFTAIAARRYAEPNLSKMTADNSDAIFRLTAHITETLIFLDLGMSVFELVGYGFHIGFIFVSFAACLIGRAINIYPITFLYNLGIGYSTSGTRSKEKPQSILDDLNNVNESFVEEEAQKDQEQAVNDTSIPARASHMLMFSGLRGAVSYGLAKSFPDVSGNKTTFVVTTMFIVLFTTFVFGGATDAALRRLEIPVGVDEEKFLQSLRKQELLTGWLQRFESTKLRPAVVRNFKKTDITSAEDYIGYEEHVEMTEMDHARVVSREKKSIYDYGQ